MSTIQTDPDGAKIEFKGKAAGKANIENLKAEYSQKAGADGSIETTIGQSSDSLKSENDQLIGGIVSGAIRGALEVIEIYRNPPPVALPVAPTTVITQPTPADTPNTPSALESLVRDRLGVR